MQLNLRSDPYNAIPKITFCRYRNYCNRLIKKLKRKYEYEQLKTNIKNSKALWKSIKEIAHLNSTKIGSCELLSTRGTPVESVNYANDYFANVGKRLAADIQSKCPHPDSSLIDTPKTQLSSFVLLETDGEEVDVVISN